MSDLHVSFISSQQDKWHPLLNTVASVHKYRWLKHSVQGVFSQSSLMGTIVEFVLKEEPLDVEKIRKCLLKQVTVKLQIIGHSNGLCGYVFEEEKSKHDRCLLCFITAGEG